MIKTAVIGPLRDKDRARLAPFADRYEFDFFETEAGADLHPYEVVMGLPSRAAIMPLENLKWLQIFWAGTDSYTLEPGFREDIAFTNVSGAFGPGIAEHILTMLLCLYKGYHRYIPDMATGAWRDHGVQESPVGKRVLILGAGDIGCCAARLLRPFGCLITGMRRVARTAPPEFDRMIGMAELDAALPEADIVVCALPGTAETRGLLDARRLGLMKSDAVLINVGRGNLVDSDALNLALREGRLAGAGLDVTEPQPLPPEHPLWHAPNVIITPHISGGSFGHLAATTDLIFDIVCENLRRYADGEPLCNPVDLRTGYRATQL